MTSAKDIRRLIQELSLTRQLRELDFEEARQVLATAKELFVRGSPRSWWLSLKAPAQAFAYPDATGYLHLADHLTGAGARFWFIPELEVDELPVFDAELGAVAELLRESPFFEYYVLSKDYRQLLIENDHNQVLVVSRASVASA
jgi:hypothetical protein